MVSKIPTGAWYRTCQECGHEQLAKEPSLSRPLPDSYANAKCKKCKSTALDYGTVKTDQFDWADDEA